MEKIGLRGVFRLNARGEKRTENREGKGTKAVRVVRAESILL
jgi:hypothetical protein